MAKRPPDDRYDPQLGGRKPHEFSVSAEDRAVVDRRNPVKKPIFRDDAPARGRPPKQEKTGWFSRSKPEPKPRRAARQPVEPEYDEYEEDEDEFEEEYDEQPPRRASRPRPRISAREAARLKREEAKIAKEEQRLALLEEREYARSERARLNARKKSAHRRRPAPRRSLIGNLIYGGFVLGIWGAIAVAIIILYHASQLPPLSRLALPSRMPNISIVGTTGEVMVTRGARGESVALSELPPTLPQAVMAIEDSRFYDHWGIDPIGLARAVVTNVKSGAMVQGGSTLTQQLAKNLFLSSERSFGRKVQELLLSFWLETKFSKDVIMELYLNRVYLGAGAYGVEAAAQRYFGKSARQLNLKESAVIAGLLKAPSTYAPTRNPEAANERAELVLNRMEVLGYISKDQARLADRDSVKVVNTEIGSSINYAADWVMDQLPGFVGSVDEDIVVETTLDPYLQRQAEEILRSTLDKEGGKYRVSQGALISVDGIGAVRALIGGRSYTESSYNRAITAKRQPGSSFKPIVYLTAMEQGLRPDTMREDSPVNIKGWTPENYSKEYRGFVTLTDALAMSLNTVAVRVGLEVGPRQVVKTAQRLGIKSNLRPDASLALGTSEVTLAELTAAYVPLANGGFGVQPYIINTIRNTKGDKIYERIGQGTDRIVSLSHVSMMNAMLTEVVHIGTAKRATIPGWPTAGKTGTSQDFRDAWFVGYTSNLVTGVWLGNDDSSPTKKASGSTLPVSIWTRFMTAAHQGIPPTALPGLEGGFMLANDPNIRPESPQSGMGNSGNAPIDLDDLPAQQSGTPPRQKNCPINQNFLNCVFGR